MRPGGAHTYITYTFVVHTTLSPTAANDDRFGQKKIKKNTEKKAGSSLYRQTFASETKPAAAEAVAHASVLTEFFFRQSFQTSFVVARAQSREHVAD